MMEGNLWREETDKPGTFKEVYCRAKVSELAFYKKRSADPAKPMETIKYSSIKLAIEKDLPKRFKTGSLFKLEISRESMPAESAPLVLRLVCQDYKQTSKWLSMFKGTTVFEKALEEVTKKERLVHARYNRTVGGRDSLGFKKEGIFRISGTTSEICAAREAVEAMINAAIGSNKDFDVDCLSPMPDPPFVNSLYKEWCDVGEIITKNKPENEIKESMKKMLDKVPDDKYTVLKHVMGLMTRVAKEEQETKMSPHNLSVVLAPSMLRNDKTTPMEALMQMNFTTTIVRTCITNFEQLFGSGLDQPFYYDKTSSPPVATSPPPPAVISPPSSSSSPPPPSAPKTHTVKVTSLARPVGPGSSPAPAPGPTPALAPNGPARPRKLSTGGANTIPMASIPLSSEASEIVRSMSGLDSINWVCLKIDEKTKSFTVADSRCISDNDFGEAMELEVAFYLFADDSKTPTEFIFVMGIPDKVSPSSTIKYATVRHSLVSELERLLNVEIVKTVEIASKNDIQYQMTDETPQQRREMNAKPQQITPKTQAHPATVPGSLANFITKGNPSSSSSKTKKPVVMPPKGAYC